MKLNEVEAVLAHPGWPRWREELRGAYLAVWETRCENYEGRDAGVGAIPGFPNGMWPADSLLLRTGCV